MNTTEVFARVRNIIQSQENVVSGRYSMNFGGDELQTPTEIYKIFDRIRESLDEEEMTALNGEHNETK